MSIREFVHYLEAGAFALGIAGAGLVGAAAAFHSTEVIPAILACVGAAVLALPFTLAISFMGATVLVRSYVRFRKLARRWPAKVEASSSYYDWATGPLRCKEASRC